MNRIIVTFLTVSFVVVSASSCNSAKEKCKAVEHEMLTTQSLVNDAEAAAKSGKTSELKDLFGKLDTQTKVLADLTVETSSLALETVSATRKRYLEALPGARSALQTLAEKTASKDPGAPAAGKDASARIDALVREARSLASVCSR